MTKAPKPKGKTKFKPKKLTAAQRKEVYKAPEDWTKQTGSDTFGSGGQVPKRRTDND